MSEKHRRGSSLSSGPVKPQLDVRSSSSEDLVAARNNLGMRINFKYLPGQGSPPQTSLPVPFVNPLVYSPKNKPRSLFRDALPLHFTPNRKPSTSTPMYRLSIFALALFLFSYVATLTLAGSQLRPLFDLSRFDFRSSPPHLIPRYTEPRCDDEPIYLVRTRDFDPPSDLVLPTPPQDQQIPFLPPPSTPEESLELYKQRLKKEQETPTFILVDLAEEERERQALEGLQHHVNPIPRPEVRSGDPTKTIVDQSGSWRVQVSSLERGVFGRRRPKLPVFVGRADWTPVRKDSRWGGWWRSTSVKQAIEAGLLDTMGPRRTSPIEVPGPSFVASFVDMQVDMEEGTPVRKDLRRTIRVAAEK